MSWSYSFDASPNINLTEDWTADTANWSITDGDLSSQNKLELVSSWRSAGTLAVIEVDHAADFKTGIDVHAYANQSFEVRYDY